MHKTILVLIILLLSSCKNGQETEPKKLSHFDDSTKSIKEVIDTSKSEFSKPLNILEDTVLNDTSFIYRKVTNDVYHGIYIDHKKKSENYNRLINFNFAKRQQKTYDNLSKKVNSKKTLKSNSNLGLPRNWLPLYMYENNFYLYAPCDWGTAGRRIITDQEFIYWNMMGPHPVQIISVKKTSEKEFKLITRHLNPKKKNTTQILIHIVNLDTKLAVFEFPDRKINYRYELYIPVESADKYSLIVNDCRSRKQLEYKSDNIDYVELLKNR